MKLSKIVLSSLYGKCPLWDNQGIVVDYKVQHLGERVSRDLNPLTDYRKGRIYLDDYIEQKELRKEYLQNNYLIVLSLTKNAYRKKKLKEF